MKGLMIFKVVMKKILKITSRKLKSLKNLLMKIVEQSEKRKKCILHLSSGEAINCWHVYHLHIKKIVIYVYLLNLSSLIYIEDLEKISLLFQFHICLNSLIGASLWRYFPHETAKCTTLKINKKLLKYDTTVKLV